MLHVCHSHLNNQVITVVHIMMSNIHIQLVCDMKTKLSVLPSDIYVKIAVPLV